MTFVEFNTGSITITELGFCTHEEITPEIIKRHLTNLDTVRGEVYSMHLDGNNGWVKITIPDAKPNLSKPQETKHYSFNIIKDVPYLARDTSDQEKHHHPLRRVKMEFNMDVVMDRACFMAICGLTQVREGIVTTAGTRFQIAKVALDRVIKHLDDRFGEDYKEIQQKLITSENDEKGLKIES